MLVHCLVEGLVDEAVARRLLSVARHEAGSTYGLRGWTYIAQRAAAFDRSCVTHGLLTLIDFMDTGERCPASVVRSCVPNRSQRHVFRVVVHEIEAWLLADREGMAKFLGVPIVKIPREPERLADPKQSLINLARRSRRRTIMESLIPQAGYSVSEGPRYSSEMCKFASSDWNVENACKHSPSLHKCLTRLKQLSH